MTPARLGSDPVGTGAETFVLVGKHCFPPILQCITILELLLFNFSLSSTFFSPLVFFSLSSLAAAGLEKLEEKHDQAVFFSCAPPSALSQVTGLLFVSHHYLFQVELLSGAPGSSGKLVQCSRDTAFYLIAVFYCPFTGNVGEVQAQVTAGVPPKSIAGGQLQIIASWGEELVLQSNVTDSLFFPRFPRHLIHRTASGFFCWGPDIL